MKSIKNNIYIHAVLIPTGDAIITNRYIIIVYKLQSHKCIPNQEQHEILETELMAKKSGITFLVFKKKCYIQMNHQILLYLYNI